MLNRKQETEQKKVLTLAHHDYEKGLNARAFFKTSSHTTGEDLVQSTFMKTWKYLIKGGKIDVMKSFLYHVLNGLIIDEYRKRKHSSLDLLIEDGFEPSVDTSESLFNMIDGKAALGLITRLPEKYRQVMNMGYIRDLSIKEISLITGKSKNTIAVQAYRGLEKLKLLYNLQ
ncbi:MAG TPA: RNA polymerase sigma factor [Candidatus Paceibacterota bacterium]